MPDPSNADPVWRLADAKAPAFFALSDRIWDRPELNYQERRYCAEHAAMLEREGFRVTTGVAGLPHRLGERRTRQLVGAVLLGSTLVLLAGRRPLRRADLAALAATLALVPPAVRTRGRSSLAAVVAIAGVDVALLGRGRPRKDPRR